MAAVEQSNRSIDETLEVPRGLLGRLNSRLNKVLLAMAISLGVAACDEKDQPADTFSQVQESTGGITSAGSTEGGSDSEGESETDGGMDSDSDSEGGTGGEEETGTTGDVDTTTGGATSEGSTSGVGTTAGPEDPCEALNCAPDEMCVEVDGEVLCDTVDNEPPITPEILDGEEKGTSNDPEIIKVLVDSADTKKLLFNIYKFNEEDDKNYIPVEPPYDAKNGDQVATEITLPTYDGIPYEVCYIAEDANGNKSAKDCIEVTGIF